MRKLLLILSVALALAGGAAQAAEACSTGQTYEQYIYCTYNPGAILATYTCVDGIVWRQTGWRVLWGCG